MRTRIAALLIGAMATIAFGLGPAVAASNPKGAPGHTKEYIGLWVTSPAQCKGDPMNSNQSWVRIGKREIETSGMDCRIDRFLYSAGQGDKDAFKSGFFDTTCTIEESSGEDMRFNYQWVKRGKVLRVGEEQAGVGSHWYSKPLTKCAKR